MLNISRPGIVPDFPEFHDHGWATIVDIDDCCVVSPIITYL